MTAGLHHIRLALSGKLHEIKRAALAILLALPALFPYIFHVFGQRLTSKPSPFLPTGFIQYDQAYYMSDARAYFQDGFHWLYASPFSYDYASPRIYFQPLTLLLGFLQHFTQADPALIYDVVGFVAAVACCRVAISLFETLFGLVDWASYSGLVVFLWGGGLLTIAGALYALSVGHLSVGTILLFDPMGGWWFLNLGRNLIMSTEATYHFIFLLTMLLVIKQRYRAALICAGTLSISHPFTGIQILLILLTWASFERFYLKNARPPLVFIIGIAVLIFLHFGYYIAFLNSFAEHKILFKQWSLPWLLNAVNFVPADALVGLLACLAIRRADLAGKVFSVRHNRLFLFWFLVSFALANHEFAVKPIQPLHFTRGYTWIPLFLIGAPMLLALLRTLPARLPRLGWPLVVMVVSLFLIDNVVWFGTLAVNDGGLRITANERQFLTWLNAPQNARTVLLGDSDLSYLATAYSPVRSWSSHVHNTPNFEQRAQEVDTFFKSGALPNHSEAISFLAVYDGARQSPPLPLVKGRPSRTVYRSGDIVAVLIEPAASKLP